MKELWENHRREILAGIGLFVLFIFAIPITINWAYKKPAGIPLLAMSWEANDVLGFYGSVLGAVIGAVAAIYVLRRTIQFTVSSQKEERKLAVRPYLETRKYQCTDLSQISTGENTVFLTISKALITYQTGLPDIIVEKQKEKERLKNAAQNLPFGLIREDCVEMSFLKHNYVLQIDIANCGAGNAIGVEFEMNQRQLLQAFCITTETPKRFICILNEDLIEKDICELEFSLRYKDISSQAKYQQTERIRFARGYDQKLMTIQREGDLLTPPVEV